MKRLAILRHAKSSWGDKNLADFDRPLNARGRQAARRIGTELTARELCFDLVLASPAARVRETLRELGRDFDLPAPMRFEPAMYLASSDLLLRIIRDIPESVRNPLLVGHNPGLHHFLLELITGRDHPLVGRIAHKFPTAAFAVVEIEAERWREVEPASGSMAELILAKDLS